MAKNFKYIVFFLFVMFHFLPVLAEDGEFGEKKTVISLKKTTQENIFNKSNIVSNGKFDNINNVKDITYKVILGDYSLDKIPQLETNQRTIQTQDNVAYFQVKLTNFSNEKFRYPPRAYGLKKYLSKSKLLDFDNENIRKILKEQLSKRPKNSYLLVKQLEKYVANNIEKEQNDTIINCASKTLLSGKGDGTDRAIFLASLLRAAKVPSKIIVGVKYKNTLEPSFAYHCWVSAYIGKWINLDIEEDDFNVAHIALCDVDLDKDVEKQIFDDFVAKLPDMEVKILDFSLIKEQSTSELAKNLELNNTLSEAGLLDYAKHSGMNADLIGVESKDINDRDFIKLQDIEAKKFVKKGVHYYINGDVDRAIINFERVFELTPVNDDYLNVDYAKKLASIGLFHLAKERLSNISEHDIWSGEIEDFYKMYMPKVLPEYPDEKSLVNLSSKIEFSPDDIEVDEVEKMLTDKKYKKSDYANFLLSKLYFAKKDYRKSYKFIQKALKINKFSFLYHMQKLNILFSRNKYGSALREINWLLSKVDNDSELFHGLNLHKQYLLSKKYRMECKKNYHLAKFYNLSNQNQKAKEILVNQVQKGFKKDRAFVLLGKVNYSLKEPKIAKENFLAALSLNKNNSQAMEALGDLEYLEHNNNKALEYYKRAIKRDKWSSELMLKIANCHKNMLDERGALYYYFQALRLNPENYKAIYNIARIKRKFGDKSNMSAIYKQILNINPNYAPAWFGLVKLALLDENIFLARRYLKPVSYIDKINPRYYYYSGLIEVMNENYSYARRDFNQALSIEPNFYKAKFELDKLK